MKEKLKTMATKTKVLTASFTALSQWERGNTEDALRIIQGLPQLTPPTDAMIIGTDYHEEFEQEVNKIGNLHKRWGFKLDKGSAVTEQTIIKPLTDWIALKGTLDVYGTLNGEPIIIDYKVGRTALSNLMATKQLMIYSMLRDENIKKVMIARFDPYIKKVELGVMVLSQEELEECRLWIARICLEIKKYCEENDRQYWYPMAAKPKVK